MHTPAVIYQVPPMGTSGGSGGGGMSRLKRFPLSSFEVDWPCSKNELYRQMYAQSFVIQSATTRGTKLEFNMKE
jgi:hypothetical protein